MKEKIEKQKKVWDKIFIGGYILNVISLSLGIILGKNIWLSFTMYSAITICIFLMNFRMEEAIRDRLFLIKKGEVTRDDMQKM